MATTVTPGNRNEPREAALANGTMGVTLLESLDLNPLPWSPTLGWNDNSPTLDMASQSSGPASQTNTSHLDCTNPVASAARLRQTFEKING